MRQKLVALSALLACAPSLALAGSNFVIQDTQLQALEDVTAGFHAAQLSQINSITNIQGGIELDVTYNIGQDQDPFGANFGDTFARVSLMDEPAFLISDLSANNSYSFFVDSTVDVFVQPFLKTGAGFVFWEANTAINASVAANTPTEVTFDFTQAQNFSGIPGTTVTDLGIVQAVGLQIVGPNNGVGVETPATIRITGSIPEPATVVTLAIALAGCGLQRRR